MEGQSALWQNVSDLSRSDICVRNAKSACTCLCLSRWSLHEENFVLQGFPIPKGGIGAVGAAIVEKAHESIEQSNCVKKVNSM